MHILNLTLSFRNHEIEVYIGQKQKHKETKGTLNKNEATKHCERYIVEQNLWKRLPELKEPKFSPSLCFFNNGSTLYCFGGVQKTGSNSFLPINTIERLSKGQNSW